MSNRHLPVIQVEIQRTHRHRHHQASTTKMKANIILLIIGHAQTEIAELLLRVRPSLAKVYIQPFINYTWPHDERGVSLIWWVKYCSDDLLWVITYFVLARVAALYSFRLFCITALWFIYHLFDSFMLWYDYRTSHWLYWVLVAGIATTIAFMFLPEKKTGRIISMK
jgi:hypothetical protein